MRLTAYAGVSGLLFAATVLWSLSLRSNYYSASIFLSHSSACLLVLMNMGFLLTFLFGKMLQRIFFGELRAIEVEHLYERSWYSVMEACLAMTIFREQFNAAFIWSLTMLLFCKIFHWISQDRVDYMSQSPTLSPRFHTRIVIVMLILWYIDFWRVFHAVEVTLRTKSGSLEIMFGFEYAILVLTILSTMARYCLHVMDMRREGHWEEKSLYLFYLDLVTDLFKLITYLIFCGVVSQYYGLPLHVIRDVYLTMRSFLQKCRDLLRYRRATRNMDERYPDATEEEFERMSDRTCIICREEMVARTATNRQRQANGAGGPSNSPGENPKRLPCGHVFHFRCLRSWLERQQACPTCRRSVIQETPEPAQPIIPPLPNTPQGPIASPPLMNPTTTYAPVFFMPPMGNAPPLWQQGGSAMQPQQQQLQQHNPETSQREATSSGEAAQVGAVPVNISLPVASISNTATAAFLSSSLQPPRVEPSAAALRDLTDDQLRLLETTTREALAERLRILLAAQEQIFQAINVLTQAINVLPTPPQSNLSNPATSTQPAATGPSSSTNAPTSGNNADTQNADNSSGSSSRGQYATTVQDADDHAEVD
ncbi:uncharacterized protein VTP21DRAFT_7678 [Calcarisporiella thermophila]|uniref:uncharacterized protein n=1 Tax=Calcarisporiella thermophila TaxID=911321 RepID=UPI003742E3E5